MGNVRLGLSCLHLTYIHKDKVVYVFWVMNLFENLIKDMGFFSRWKPLHVCGLTPNLHIIPRVHGLLRAHFWTPMWEQLIGKQDGYFHLRVDMGVELRFKMREKSNDFLFFLDLSIHRLILKWISRTLNIPTSKTNFKWITSWYHISGGQIGDVYQ